ncbi:threonine transporter [Acinetobacter sp. ANC 4558]|uniref:LysE family translocator n=1 Tax=Acinetobacter sp. ANC 4558 TaxID=1977876 RepID=UPI000A341F3B|nr:LysE family translocator [Acinetobacter sp. ANC 4558]OTG86129.1 threonine transporter [Acinetobacter sp. ANC 4558]
MESIWAFCIFAFVASITPGPTNFLILSTSHQYGLNKSFSIILGASIGAALLVLLLGVGLGQSINHHPTLKLFLSIIGGVWLSSLAWKIYKYQPNIQVNLEKKSQKIGFLHGFLLQLINPKSWIMAMSVITIYLSNTPNYLHFLFMLSGIFMLISIPCLFAWAWLGIVTKQLLNSNQQIIIFNRILAMSLFICVWYPIFAMQMN